jgi:hypothetical protein
MSRLIRCALLTGMGVLLASLLVAAAAPSAQSASTPTTFSGQATVIKGSLSLLPAAAQSLAAQTLPCKPADPTHFCIVDTGPVSAGGGALNESLLCYPDGANCAVGLPDVTGGMINARVLHAAVVAQGNNSHADATVANLGVVVPGLNVSAEFIRADADATCTQGKATVSGSVELATVNGQQILVVNGVSYTIPENTPNYQVPLPPVLGVSIVVNEQPTSNGASNGSGQIDVTAVHIYTPLGDIAIGQVHADITCGQLIGCPGPAFVTSGGYISDPLTGAKLHFAAAGRNNTAWGHVMYGATGLHVKDPTAVVFGSLTDLEAAIPSGFSAFAGAKSTIDGNAGKFQGAAILSWTAAKTGTPVPGEALLIDMGEPGNQPKGYDFFELASGSGSNVASVAGGLLQGGNVQMHGKC